MTSVSELGVSARIGITAIDSDSVHSAPGISKVCLFTVVLLVAQPPGGRMGGASDLGVHTGSRARSGIATICSDLLLRSSKYGYLQ